MRKSKIFYLLPISLILFSIIAGAGCNPLSDENSETPAINTMPASSTTSTAAETTLTTQPPETTLPPDTSPPQTSAQGLRNITVTEAYAFIQENKDNPDFIIIDIRTPEEFESGHIENAVMINYYDENFRDELSKLDRDKTYLEYCRTARRSGLALEVFQELGFKNVLNMEGGITEWIAQGYPVAGGG